LVLPEQQAEERVNTLNRLSISLCYKKFDESEQYATEAMTLAKELDYQEGIADAYRNYGHIAFYQSNFPDALNYYLESLHLFEKQDKKYKVARVYFDITKTHLFASNYEKVFDYGNIALDKYREPVEGGATVGSARDTTILILGLAQAYGDLKMYNKVLESRLKMFELGKLNNFENTEMVLNNYLVGSSYYLLGKDDSARVYWERALAYPDENPSIEALKYRPIAQIADLYYAEGKIDSAKLYKQIALEWYSENGYLFWATDVSTSLANICFNNNEFVSAEKYFRQSEKLFKEMTEKNSWYRYDSLKHVVSYGTELYLPIPYNQMKEKMWLRGARMYYGLYQFSLAKKKNRKCA